jgi:hypothetical protein
MEKMNLSETEKKVLRALSASQYDDNMFGDLSREELYVASNRLKRYGLIAAHFAEGGILFAAKILDEGIVYLKENPNLENPIDENEIKRLQKDELEYQKHIRKQEDVIRYWKLLNIVISIIAVVGWLFFFFRIR